jgi:urease accessory protein
VSAPTADAHVLRLLTWLSPAFPVGGYAYSHGVETAIAQGLVRDAAGLAAWIAVVMHDGSGRSDGALLAAAHGAAARGDEPRLLAVAARAQAFRPTAELAMESETLGAAFVKGIAAGWPEIAARPPFARLLRRERPPAFSVAVGAAAAVADIPLRPTLLAYLAAFAAGLVSAGVRLIPLGQTQGLRITAGLERVIGATVDRAMATDIADLASATWLHDLCSAWHETQTVRLFRS